MLTSHSADSWFPSYTGAHARMVDALCALRQSTDKRTQGAPVRRAFAASLRDVRTVDRAAGAVWAGQRVTRAQYDKARPGYTVGRF